MNKGFTVGELILALLILSLISIIPICCHYEVRYTQDTIKKVTNVELTYGEAFWANPKIVMGQHAIELE